MILDNIDAYISDSLKTLTCLPRENIVRIIGRLIEAYNNGNQIFILGNGGSASSASHFACDLGKGTLKHRCNEREKRFRIISLTDNFPLISAYANDISFDEIFSQQLRNLIVRNDLVIVLSGSGNSRNLIKAVDYAKKCGAYTIGLLGFNKGGKLAKLVDDSIIIQSSNYGQIEDSHLILNHMITYCISQFKEDYDKSFN